MLKQVQHDGRCLCYRRTMERQPCVYILSKKFNGALYIGVTSDLMKRLHQHRNGLLKGHAARYRIVRLVRFEMFDDMEHAIAREKQLKNWRREWKLNLIESENPDWVDLAIGWGFDPWKEG